VRRPTGVLTCYRARRRLGAYLDGALGEADTRWVDRHLSTCSDCQGEIGQLRRVKALVVEAAAVPEPDWTGFFPGIVRGIEAERHRVEPARARRSWSLWPRWAMGGAAVAALALSFVVWQGAQGPVPAEASVLINVAESDHPGATVMVYTPPAKDLAVVWLFDTD
jgi:predicted anti-sigma-YlaC factor YlaD